MTDNFEADLPKFHKVTVKVPLPFWNLLRSQFPERGQIQAAINLALKILIDQIEPEHQETDQAPRPIGFSLVNHN
jgi:hypothetical protein